MSSFLMGYPHPHFQGPIGGPAIDPKFPPTEDFLSPYHHHHHHHMHLNHEGASPLHNGYSTNSSSNGNQMLANLQPPPTMDYYGNSGASYNYPSNNYYNQAPHLPPTNSVSPLHNSRNNNSSTNVVNNNSNNNSSVNLDAYANNGNITEMASVPATQGTTVSGGGGGGSGLNHATMHPYSAATAAVTNSGVSSANSRDGGVGLVGSYYSGYYGSSVTHHHSVMDLPIQCPHTEPTNTALGLQELGKVKRGFLFCRRWKHLLIGSKSYRTTSGAANRGGCTGRPAAARAGNAIKM